MVTAESEWVLSSSNNGNVTAPTEGRALDSDLSSLPRIPMGGVNGERFRSVTIAPLAVGADNSTVTLTLWGRRRTSTSRGASGEIRSGTTSPDGIIIKLGTLVCTACASTGKTNGVVTTSERICDTLVWTAETYWTNLETAFGQAAVAHSPGSDKPAELILPDVGGFESLYIAATLGTATAWNAVIFRQT